MGSLCFINSHTQFQRLIILKDYRSRLADVEVILHTFLRSQAYPWKGNYKGTHACTVVPFPEADS